MTPAQIDAYNEMSDVLKAAMCRAYAAGYMHGHEATVGGEFIPIHPADVKDYFAENVKQMVADGSQPEVSAVNAKIMAWLIKSITPRGAKP